MGIILAQHKHKKHRRMLKQQLPAAIYKEFERRIKLLPLEFYFDESEEEEEEEKVVSRRIVFEPPDDESILSEIAKHGQQQHPQGLGPADKSQSSSPSNSMHSGEFSKLLILDHIQFEHKWLRQFLE